jgi:hypothetical protein
MENAVRRDGRLSWFLEDGKFLGLQSLICGILCGMLNALTIDKEKKSTKTMSIFDATVTFLKGFTIPSIYNRNSLKGQA